MSNLNLVVGKKYHVKGFSKPVVLEKYNNQTKTAYVNDGGTIKSILINDILEPVIDSILVLLGRWIKSLFSKK